MLGRNIHSGTQQHLKASVIPGLPEIELSLLDLGTFPLRPKASLPSLNFDLETCLLYTFPPA